MKGREGEPRSEVERAVDAHVIEVEFGAEGEGIGAAGAGRFRGGFAMENDAVGVRVESGLTVDLLGEMKFDARVFVIGALDEADGGEIDGGTAG